ncbi:unnamed protein product [Urochloa humidicola]
MEGWRKIVTNFNMSYPEANFSEMQIQEHETQLKKDYKFIKLILQRDGVSYQSASMIRGTDEIWDEIIEDDGVNWELAAYIELRQELKLVASR